MAAAKKFDAPKDAPPRDGTFDPSHASFERGASKLDVVDCLIERRRFRADREFGTISGIQIYSDSSPVTGEELQGMLMDVCYKDGRGRRVTLPGSTLCYGQFGAIAKNVAVLLAICLVCVVRSSRTCDGFCR